MKWGWVLLCCFSTISALNLAPVFQDNMNQHTIRENTPVGSIIYTLKGEDPEGARVRYGLSGTDLLKADPLTGAVTVLRDIDRETVDDNEVRLVVTIQDEPQEGQPPNIVRVPISVIILDENDNEPIFRGLPYKASIAEDTPVGSTLFQALEVTDADLVGDVLDVQCVHREGFEEGVCDNFEILPRRLETDHDMFRGSVVLKKPLDYRLKQLYSLPIVVKDGRYEVLSSIVFSILDVQNTPPVFMGSLTGILSEDDPVGTRVLTVKARDGDTGQARRIIYSLEENPQNYFAIDATKGDITIDKPIDRESLGPSSGGVLMLRVRASELVNGIPNTDDITSTKADVTITIRDVNDEAPLFNQDEYRVSLTENVPFGTPLANLNMEVKDLDTAPNAVFDINLVGGDPNGKFSVEPRKATGHTAVSLKVNSQNLDYENANERKFLLLVEAKESNNGKLSSTATVTVVVSDLNDNSPEFPKNSYTAIVSEAAPEDFEIITIQAEDRDSGNFGTLGIRYELSGQGAELFKVDPSTGKITVASCIENCLDYETIRAYYLSFSATDNNGSGKKTVVNLRISVADANDNPPKFVQKVYKATINEGEQKFDPPLFIKATDRDESSILRFKIEDGNTNNLFAINRLTGEITVRQRNGLRLDNIPTDLIRLSVQVSDGSESSDEARVEINVKDVNDRSPIFEKQTYLSSVPEIAPIGTPIEDVQATDADYGPNAEITYRISKGAYDDFAINGVTGQITLNGDLDYDRRDSYSIEVIAVDGGTPALSGTATLTVSIMNKNNKEPYFFPATQRAQITENTPQGALVIALNATDPDATGEDNLIFNFIEPITAVDKDGARVSDADGRFKNFFTINQTTGEVFVSDDLDRSVAAIVTLTVTLTDLSAEPEQVGYGNLVVTIVDVNDFPPAFLEPWTPQRPFLSISVPEEQPEGTVVHTFRATDADSNIDQFRIINPSRSKRPYRIDADTGDLIITDRIDYEALENKQLTFDLAVYDAGVPQKSAMASVVVNVENLNDEAPTFDQDFYSVAVKENSPVGFRIITVQANDKDEGEFGQVRYELNHPAFAIDPIEGVVSITNPDLLDREVNPMMTVQIVAKDVAPNSRSTSVPLNITIQDVNDNPPRFIKRRYKATIVDNIPYYPDPSPIIQLLAEDDDIGSNGELFFYILNGNEQEQFFIDPSKGIIYPNTSFVGQNGATFRLQVQVFDEAGQVQAWDEPDQAVVDIIVENVNTHQPEWFPDPPPNETIELMEEEDISNYVILKVNARDRDSIRNGNSDNGRVSYHFKIKNENVEETDEFMIDTETGEVRTKIMFDRELQDSYELVLVARDHGTPVSFETLRFVTIKIKDINDHDPTFEVQEDVRFTVPEEEDPGYFVGKVEANDPDEGKNGRVFYYIINGNEDKWFSIDKTYGNIYTKKRLDRETRDHYVIQVKTSNNPDLVCEGSICDIPAVDNPADDNSVILVHIFVEDKNDNLPQFEATEFNIGIPFDAKIGDLILDAKAKDPDVPSQAEESYANTITYNIRTSNLYRSGSTQSSGSLVPSPFEMEQSGRLILSSLVAEFTQDKFVIEIEAKESKSNHRTKATVNLWIYEPDQLVRLIVDMPPMQVNREKRSILNALRNVTRDTVVLDDIRYHISDTEGLRRDMTDMYVHVVDPGNNIVAPDDVVDIVDANYDTLAKVYTDAGIQKIIPVASTEKTTKLSDYLDANLSALIALLIVLFLGVILFSILCCCIKNYNFAAATAKASKPLKMPPASPGMSRPMSAMGGGGIYNNPTSLIDSPDGGPVSGTENPLWIDQKYKAYEEQELTMMVFSDQENSVISGQTPQQNGNGTSRPGSISRASAFMNAETNSNAYATINKLPLVAGTASRRRSLLGMVHDSVNHDNSRDHGLGLHGQRDYATLEKMSPRSPPGPIVPGVHSSTPLGGIARRFSNDFANTGSRANLIINQNGEPELVADLM